MISGLHIEPTNICTLRCPGCARTQFIDQWPKRWQNHSLDATEVMDFLDIDLAGLTVTMCGNYGDPIYHPDALDFFRCFKHRQANLTIITNGSYKNPNWWKDLVSILDSNDKIIFSVDGIPENFQTYRINADWSSIRQGMEICAQSSVVTKWKYIPFHYNQSSIQQARTLSGEMGLDDFFLDFSDRFDKSTQHLIPDDSLIGQRKSFQDLWKKDLPASVQPKCQDRAHHYISAEGFYSPCCYICDHRFYYKTEFGKNKESYDIRRTRMSEIAQRPSMIEFYPNITQNPLPVCQYSCPKTD